MTDAIVPARPFFSGLVGRVVEAFEPYTEASSAAIAAQFVVGFGNCVGRGPRIYVGETAHHMNESLLVVGRSGRSRKGDSRNIGMRVLREADPSWRSCVKGGASSGEGLIYHVRDESLSRDENGETKVVDSGVSDKRLLVSESEFASVLRRSTQKSNTLTVVMRDGWDGISPLSTLTKNSPLRATDAHISVIAHTTPNDLHKYMADTEAANGFGNRFLFLLIDRSKLLPTPGRVNRSIVSELALETRAALDTARNVGELRRSSEAEALWQRIYPDLSLDHPGLIGSLIARSEAHTLRLAALYALMDQSAVISADHLESALAFWQVCELSARAIFRERTGSQEADRIMESTRPGDRLTLTELRDDVFGGSITSARLAAAVRLLVDLGEGRTDKPGGTGGRSTVVFERTPPVDTTTRAEKQDKQEKPPVEDPFSGFSGFSEPGI